MTRPISIFYVYAETEMDEALRQQLEKHLVLLRRQRVIAGWEPILAGAPWAEKMEHVFNEAKLILLLVSADFHADARCQEHMQRALERQHQGEVQVIPILLRPVDWKSAPFAHLQVLPTNGESVTSWANQDEAFAQVIEGIRCVLEGKPLPSVAPVHLVPEKKPSKMSNRVKSAPIGAAVVIIAALLAGIFLLHSTPSTPVLDRPGTPFLDDSMTSPNNKDQWDLVGQGLVSCGFSNGGYDVKVPANAVGGCATTASTTVFTDFIYEINMTIVSGATNDTSSTRGAGVMFHYSQPDGASNDGISFQQDGTYYMFTYKDGEPGVSLGSGYCEHFNKGANQTNQIDVEMQGSTITLFVNDTYVTTKEDSQFQSGQLGVQVGSGNDPSEVVYNNLKVWKL